MDHKDADSIEKLCDRIAAIEVMAEQMHKLDNVFENPAVAGFVRALCGDLKSIRYSLEQHAE